MIEYLQTNAVELIAIVGAVVTVASLIANLTPTDADNKIVSRIAAIIDLLALNIRKK